MDTAIAAVIHKNELLPKILKHFSAFTYRKGWAYFDSNKVVNLDCEIKNNASDISIHALVTGSYQKSYKVIIEIQFQEVITLRQRCSCPIGDQCKHVVAVLIAFEDRVKKSLKAAPKESLSPPQKPSPLPITSDKVVPFLQQPVDTSPGPLAAKAADTLAKKEALSPGLHSWLKTYQQQMVQTQVSMTPSRAAPKTQEKGVAYILSVHSSPPTLSPYTARILKSGQLSANADSFDFHSLLALSKHPAIRALLSAEEVEAGWLLLRGQKVSPYLGHSLEGKEGFEALKLLIATGKVYNRKNGSRFSWGDSLPLELEWKMEKGKQRLTLNVCGYQLLSALSPPCYYNPRTYSIGPIDTPLPALSLKFISDLPAFDAREVQQLYEALAKVDPLLASLLPAPMCFKEYSTPPIPHLHIYFRHDEELDAETLTGDIQFYYEDIRLWPIKALPLAEYPQNIASELHVDSKGEYVQVNRDMSKEREALEQLTACGFQLSVIQRSGKKRLVGFIDHEHVLEGLITFLSTDCKALKDKGWQIQVDQQLPFQEVEEADEWYFEAGLGVGQQEDWFDVSLGVLIDGERVNLVPLLERFNQMLMEEGRDETFLAKEIVAEEKIYLVTDEGKAIIVSAERVQAILRAFALEMNQKEGDSPDFLRLARWKLLLFNEMQKAQDALAMRWLDADKHQALASAVRYDNALTEVQPSPLLACSLRPYQRQGLNWLQWLRRCQLNGILADDMGLGKTVQTLALLLTEQDEGRLDRPTLVIAPTSLMPNWQAESKRLAPSLKVLVLQGYERKSAFQSIDKHDLVLTTYPLIRRDKSTLLAHDFHYLILDEAQMIKNARTQSYQVVQQIRARHRLCLSGTPMENHLGEIWALFNVLMPGLLGDHKVFHRLFRLPIEKKGSAARQQMLNQRLNPFMLRRTKQQVASELPPKTEIVQYIDLTVAQRDLYEALRIKAQQRVASELEKKGLQRSHITILDALLKLRQVCCDPRLLKVEEKITWESAKFNFLMETVPQMLAEGRQIIIFSQFTSMLALISQELTKQGIDYCMLTGMTKNREEPISQFQRSQKKLMLISLKAGGTGLNLTAADTVFHYDPWWNPAVEDQATDRVHRIGQTKNTFVYKLVTRGTVEEKILSLQTRKRQRSTHLLQGAEKQSDTWKLTEEDIAAIFQPLPTLSDEPIDLEDVEAML